MRILLHIGAPKAGSSALQFFLNNNRDELFKNGYYYPRHSVDDNFVSGGHGFLAKLISDGNLSEARSLTSKWVRYARRKRKNLILSSEAFYSIPKELASLLSAYEVRVLAFVREPVAFAISNHNQAVKRHFNTQTLEQFLSDLPARRNRGINGELFFEWASVVGRNNIELLPYKKGSFEGVRIEEVFLEKLGLESAEISAFSLFPKRVNNSYTVEALEFKRLLNYILDPVDKDLSRSVDLFLQEYSDRKADGGGELLLPPVTEHVLTCASESFVQSNERLVNEFFDGCNIDFLDPPNFSSFKHSIDYWEVHNVYRDLKFNRPEICKRLTCRIEDRLISQKKSLDMLRLADIFRVSVSMNEEVDGLEMYLPVFNGLQSKAPDFLRALAKLLLNRGYALEAKAVIDEAQALRPNGKGIGIVRREVKNIIQNQRG